MIKLKKKKNHSQVQRSKAKMISQIGQGGTKLWSAKVKMTISTKFHSHFQMVSNCENQQIFTHKTLGQGTLQCIIIQ